MHKFPLRRVVLLLSAAVLLSGCNNDIEAPGPGIGTIVMDCSPDDLEIGWQLSGPDGFLAEGHGDSTLTQLEEGDYTISWEPRAGWISPPAATEFLSVQHPVIFVAGFVARWPFPDTPEQLMANFKAVYEAMDSTGYTEMLAPDYRMILKGSTTLDFPELGETLDYDEEARIAGHMFSGVPGHDPYGFLTSPISSILFQALEQLTAWDTSLPTDPIPDTPSALFDVLIEFNRIGDKSLRVFHRARN